MNAAEIVALAMRRIQAGECDLRDVGQLLTGRWSQDEPRLLLDELSTLRERCERLEAERGRGSSLIAELVEALEGAREALWDYGAPENDIAPIRKAIAKAASEKHPSPDTGE